MIEPELRNANLTRLNTKINATNVEVDFLIPNLQILNEKYLMTDEDLINGDIEISRGRTSIIKNYSLKLSANLGYVPNVGIQVSNVAMNFGVDSFLTRTANVTVIYPNGTVEDKGGWESDNAEYFNSEWVRIGADVTADAETWLNCYLSNGRNGNAKCEELLNDNWEIQNFAQLLQSIGLGIQRSRQEELAKTAVAEIKKEYPRFLPEFLVPTISSALLDIPTLFLQLGKIYGGSDERTFSGYPLSYEYDRENCTLGVCRNVQEHITVPSFSLQGLSANRVQLDFQPTNFTISLKVPNASLVSESFQREITDLESGYREIYLGLQLSIGKAAFAISGDYEFKDGVGIQVSNLGLTLLLGELQLRVPYYFTVDNGVESEIQEYKLDFAPQLMETWRGVDEDGVSFERKYEEYIQTEINALLSNSGSIQNL
ncbi:hypothetical protein Ocin01_19654 [Orchesella cincta]|uniref:Uncharacterized protein n=1 Tax=Orchesella cincta TaxID=48709 RepID=A0A1D2M231_ORCCI|nr:hypothetical protein Ocin01_19654 [Orchesella cincta]